MAFIEFNKRTGVYTYDEEMITQVESFRRLDIEYGVRAIHYLWLWCRAGSPVQYIENKDEKDEFLVAQLNKLTDGKLGAKLSKGLYRAPSFVWAEKDYCRLNLDKGSIEQTLYINARETLQELLDLKPTKPEGKRGSDPEPQDLEKYLKNSALRNKALKDAYKELKDLTKEMQDSTSGGIWAKGGSMFEIDDLLREANDN